MNTPKTVAQLVEAINKQTLIQEAAKAKADELKAELLEALKAEGVTKAETQHGKAVIIETHDFDLAGFPEVAQAKAAFDSAKKDAQALAPFTLKQSLRFTPNRGFEVPAQKGKRVWKTRVLLRSKATH
jgi:hypothetical protein